MKPLPLVQQEQGLLSLTAVICSNAGCHLGTPTPSRSPIQAEACHSRQLHAVTFDNVLLEDGIDETDGWSPALLLACKAGLQAYRNRMKCVQFPDANTDFNQCSNCCASLQPSAAVLRATTAAIFSMLGDTN
jgi:hypothetical protein